MLREHHASLLVLLLASACGSSLSGSDDDSPPPCFAAGSETCRGETANDDSGSDAARPNSDADSAAGSSGDGERNLPNVTAPPQPGSEGGSRQPAPEPPLSADELARLASFDGLVSAEPWRAAVSPIISQEKVVRAYLDWKDRFFKSCADGSVYVLKNDYTGSEQVASEGIAYGMLLAVAIGDREAFDGLARYYLEHRNGNGVMNWLYAPCGGQIDGNGASDADLDAAMALVLGDDRWGGHADAAADLIDAIRQHETQICDDGRIVLKPGDAWGGCGGTLNPSYFSPAYYRRFADVRPGDAEFWNAFVEDTYDMLSRLQDQRDGLLPDWSFGNGDADGGDRGIYGYEAVRSPWRIALDYGWSGNPRPREFLERISAHVDRVGGVGAMADQESFEDKRNSAFLGSLSLSGVTNAEKLETYVTEWETYDSLDDQWYYQATLRVLFLMTAGGFFPASY